MKSNVYKCSAVTSTLKDAATGKEITVTTGPYRKHLFNEGVSDKKDARCMRCGASR